VSRSGAWRWVPSLYFAEGLPYVAVMTVSVILYKSLGLGNDVIAFYTSWLYLPWIIKPFWSPIVDLLRTRRSWIVATQLLIGAGFAAVALALPAEDYFRYSLAAFCLLAFSSATHDIAADGFYILGLDDHQQAWWVGIRNTFYRIAMITGQGVLVMVAGRLEERFGDVALAWSVTFFALAATFIALAAWHALMLPRPDRDRAGRVSGIGDLFAGFAATFVSFFKKPGIAIILAFLLLYRFAEAQLVKIAAPFLLDGRETGGLALTTSEVGLTYGTVGALSLTIGGILGGFLAAASGLKRWLLWMVVAINIPNGVYIALAWLQPKSLFIINAAVAIEQFGYGLGFTAYTLYMLYVARGEHSTAHFAICTGFMALGMMIPGLFSGAIQLTLGYQWFFVWVLVATIPSFFVVRLIPLDADFGRKNER